MMNDIGFVQYSKNTNKKIIEATWFYLMNREKISGTGIVKGKFDNTFAGDFNVKYYNKEGVETSNYKLIITLEENQYQLKWITNDIVEYFGIGIEYDNKLFAGWRKFQEYL